MTRGIPMNPQAMKQVNMANIRNMLQGGESATRAQLAQQINISTTTVRSLLCEMQENREILACGHNASSGGRRAERYSLNPERFCGAAFCVGDGRVGYSIINLFGRPGLQGSFPHRPARLEDDMLELLESRLAPDSLRAVCVGVPGVITGQGYTVESKRGQFESYAVGAKIQRRFGVPVVLENNLNLITMGMGRCHQSSFPAEAAENLNMAYLHFETGCVSAGFLSGGRLVRGFSSFAGELGMMPGGGGLSLAKQLDAADTLKKHAEIISTIVKWIILILNPQYISFGGPAFGGPSFRRQAISLISDILYADMPHGALPELLYTEDTRHDYDEGLAALCVEQMFHCINKATQYSVKNTP